MLGSRIALIAPQNNVITSRQLQVSSEAFRAHNSCITYLLFTSTNSKCSTLPMRRYFSSSSYTSDQDSVVATCRKKISLALETDQVTVIGAHDDPNGSHISIEVVSALFEGKRLMQRQQMVYKAIWEEMQGPVHAVDSMVCKTPSEIM